MIKDDAFLWKELQKGNQKAFKTLYEKYWEHLYATAFYWLDSREEAEEIMQDVFMELWEKRNVLVIRKSLAAYLFSNTKYKVFDRIDAQVVRKKYVASQSYLPQEADDSTVHAYLYQETLQRINVALEQLPAKTRQVFALSRDENLPHAEIAKRLDLSVKTVEYHISKTLRYLRLILKSLPLLYSFQHLLCNW